MHAKQTNLEIEFEIKYGLETEGQKDEAAQRDHNERHDPMAPVIERFQNQRMTSEQFSNDAPNQNWQCVNRDIVRSV